MVKKRRWTANIYSVLLFVITVSRGHGATAEGSHEKRGLRVTKLSCLKTGTFDTSHFSIPCVIYLQLGLPILSTTEHNFQSRFLGFRLEVAKIKMYAHAHTLSSVLLYSKQNRCRYLNARDNETTYVYILP